LVSKRLAVLFAAVARRGPCSTLGGENNVPRLVTQVPGRPRVNQKTTRKPFVTPQLKEEASLADVTLVSGGGVPSLRRQGRYRGFRRHGHRHGNGGRDS
jgi:hypothetical protein